MLSGYLCLFFTIFSSKNLVRTIDLLPSETAALLTLKNGKVRKEEAAYGSSFLSQSSRSVIIPSDVSQVEILDNSGKKRVIKP
ncbi:hypothetical protein [Emticicia sp. TH156]|uniref:hypothetical protein n=1 Tax=Emticicia sp. TH156 TaxID=2067454 RepID=UPI000CBE9476|nr:hypothetical protein [Emticicia sp. TH156]PLK43436.1 hypothetical protein C0V77_16145 [Emticicia sp. TH156]